LLSEESAAAAAAAAAPDENERSGRAAGLICEGAREAEKLALACLFSSLSKERRQSERERESETTRTRGEESAFEQPLFLPSLSLLLRSSLLPRLALSACTCCCCSRFHAEQQVITRALCFEPSERATA
jgi:hypothetical protein